MLHLLCRLWFVRQPPLGNTGVIITRLVGLLEPCALTVSLLTTSEMWLTLCALFRRYCARCLSIAVASAVRSLDLSSTGSWRRALLFLTFALCSPYGAPLIPPPALSPATRARAQGASIRSSRGVVFASSSAVCSPRALRILRGRPVSR